MTVGLADRPLTDEDLARMRAEAESLHAAKTAHRQAVEARRIGTLAMIEPGVAIWSSYGDEPRGGVVVEEAQEVLRDTGEIIRRFTYLNPFKHVNAWEGSMPETEIMQDGVEIMPSSRLVTIARRLAEMVGKGGGVATPRDLRHAKWAHALLVIAMGGGR